MPKNHYKKPTLDQFGKIVETAHGNLSLVARSLKVSRATISEWMRQDSEFKVIVNDERLKLFDEALATARVLVLGIPAYETDEEGRKRIVGWVERPSESMCRYILGKLGRNEGFGDEPVDINLRVNNGVSIQSWIEKMNSGKG